MVALAVSTIGRARRQEYGYPLVWQGAAIPDAVEVLRQAVGSVLAAAAATEVDSPSYSTGVLESGRLAVTFGTVEQWLDPAVARAPRREGLTALSPCVLARDEIDKRRAR